MKLSEICIERPVFAWVMTLVLILVGAVLGSRLPLQQYPKIEQPAVTIETILQGAGPEIVEAQVTKILEEAFAGIEGVDHVSSVSNTNTSNITITFLPARNIDAAVNDIRDRISRERDKLPEDCKEPVLTKTRVDEGPIMSLSFWSDSMARKDIYDLISQDIQKDFESIQGVGRVDVYGDGLFVMNLYVDPKKMASYGISVDEVIQSVRAQNFERPAGKIVSKNREFLVTTFASLEKPEEFERLIVLTKNNTVVRFGEIGRAEIKSAEAKSRAYFNGKQGVSLTITKQSNVNPISVARKVKKEIEFLKKTRLPENLNVVVSYDSTLFVERSLKEVYKTIFEAVLLVTFVVLLFLKSFRAAIVPLVTIPVSLIGSMIFMYLFGFSLNTFTLLAFVLAVGLVVDDAIVVLENVYRYMEEGLPRLKASVKGIKEVSFAVIAMTLTLAAVYTPVALATGMTGKLLSEFAVTLACAVILSGFAALTLSPMMCARVLVLPSNVSKVSPRWIVKIKKMVDIDLFMNVLIKKYDNTLRIALDRKFFVISFAVFFACIGLLVFITLPSQLFPKEDNGLIRVDGHAAQSATLDYTERYVKIFDSIAASIPEIETRDIHITNPSFDASFQLRDDKKRSSDEITAELTSKIKDITGVDFTRVQSGRSGASNADTNVEFVVRGNKSHKELRELARAVGLAFKNSGTAREVLSVTQNDTEDYTITILRDKVSMFFIEPRMIARTIDALIRGQKVNTFKKDNKLYDVKVEVENESRAAPEDILNINVKGGEHRDKSIPLSELISITPRSGPVEVFHYNRTRAVSVTGKLNARYGVNDGINKVNEVKKDILPKDVVVEFIGSTKQFLEENKVMGLVFALAVVFIYLVMAAQFESWRDPLIILFSVPLAIASAILTLAIINNGSINLYSNIGLITLIGLITKHGILIVDFANKTQLSGKNKFDSVIEASLIRLRPVLMTTFAMVLGTLPLAFATGAGAETRWQLGWTIVGGMTFGTLFTLFVVPAFYVLLSKVKAPVTVQ